MTRDKFEQAQNMLAEMEEISLLEDIVRYLGYKWNDVDRKDVDYTLTITSTYKGFSSNTTATCINEKIPSYNNALMTKLLSCIKEYRDKLEDEFENL